jgi:hypothetical protein
MRASRFDTIRKNPATPDLLVINAVHELELTADAVSLLAIAEAT